jgi:hypothetical protein
MNGRSLDEIIASAIDRAREEGVTDEESIMQRVLDDPDMQVLLDGYRMHDRSEGLEDVMKRDIQRKVEALLRSDRQT